MPWSVSPSFIRAMARSTSSPRRGCGAVVMESACSSNAVAAGSRMSRSVLPAHPGKRLSSQMTNRPAASPDGWVGRVGLVEDDGAVDADLAGGAVVDRGGGVQPESGMPMFVVIGVEEGDAE